MTHIEVASKLDKSNRQTPKEWLAVGKQIGVLANTWAGRKDLIVILGPDGGQGAVAMFDPSMHEIEVNTDTAFPGLLPSDIGDLSRRRTQFEHAEATGMIFHEALHAKHSTWDMHEANRSLTSLEFDVLTRVLEENRIEALGIKEFPKNKPFLRKMTLTLMINDVTEETKKQLAGQTHVVADLFGRTMGRVYAGTLKERDTNNLRKVFDKTLPLVVRAKLKDILVEAQQITPATGKNLDRLYELSREWVKLIEEIESQRRKEREQQRKEAEKQRTAQGESQEGSKPQSGPSGDDEMQELLKELMKALRDDAQTTQTAAQRDLNEQEDAEETEEQIKQAEAESAEQSGHIRMSTEVFERGSAETISATNSRLIESRPPRGEETAAAVVVSRELDKARYRDRVKTRTTSKLPPGRLRTRGAVQGAALRARGLVPDVEPWRRTVNKRVEEPKLTVGVLVDISGSMKPAMEAMATTAYVLSEAIRRIQGKTAMVYFGNTSFATLRPGEHLRDVKVYTAADGSHDFDHAFQAIDGGLNLLRGHGARLLVVCSDGHYGLDETARAEKWMSRCKQAGVAVLWVNFSEYPDRAKPLVDLADGEYVYPHNGVTDAAYMIGKTAAETLTRHGKRF
jgi:hypothetical protein